MNAESAIAEELRPSLDFSRGQIESQGKMDMGLMKLLGCHPALQAMVGKLTSIPGLGSVTALAWALEVGDPERFSSNNHALGYRGLSSAPRGSAG